MLKIKKSHPDWVTLCPPVKLYLGKKLLTAPINAQTLSILFPLFRSTMLNLRNGDVALLEIRRKFEQERNVAVAELPGHIRNLTLIKLPEKPII